MLKKIQSLPYGSRSARIAPIAIFLALALPGTANAQGTPTLYYGIDWAAQLTTIGTQFQGILGVMMPGLIGLMVMFMAPAIFRKFAKRFAK